MTELKSLKIALITSLVSLILSCAMLVGTTYAWFVDSVSTSDNRILTGSLSIDILMDKSGNGTYTSIADGSGDIFAEANGGKAVGWEPDKTQIVYLGIKNTGDLALQYSLLFDIEGSLAGALQYAILDGAKAKTTKSGDWSAIAGAADKTGQLKAGQIPIIQNGELKKNNQTHYFAIAVHMADNVLNTYQGSSITVDLSLVSAQTAHEEDTFGKDYDKDADKAVTIVTIDSLADFKKFTKAVNTGETYKDAEVANNTDAYVKLTADIDLKTYTDFYGIGDGEYSFDGTFNGNGHTIKNWSAENVDTPLALFNTSKGAQIKNLTIEKFKLGEITTKGTDYGVLIGRIDGGKVVIDKVTVKDCEVTCKEAIGALVGTMTEGHLTVTECKVMDVTLKNHKDYDKVAGVLLGNGYSKKNLADSGFEESDNTIKNVEWFCGDYEETEVPEYNYKK